MEDKESLGILLVNLGTPDEPKPSAIRRYLAEFLRDQRVVNLPRYIWLPILYGIILPIRPRILVSRYESIWGETDAPIRSLTKALAARVESSIASQYPDQVMVRSAMTYGNPSIQSALEELTEVGVDKLLVIPLFPQYSGSTTAAVFDRLSGIFSGMRVLPSLGFISDYHNNSNYISAITQPIQPALDSLPENSKLIISFHGLPKSQIAAGDPYQNQCENTAALMANQLNLESHQWQITYQSQTGRSEWTKPYTNEVLASLPNEGTRHVVVVCPGFSVDCLETLEEIEIRYKKAFIDAGGETFTYIPALNATQPHVDLISDLILNLR